MQFDATIGDYRPWFDLFQIVYAEGEIVPGTADQFEQFAADKNLIPSAHIYIDTPGGSLDEGLKLGRKIRELGFNTNVGRRLKDQTEAGTCASAGVFAYLGGVYRYMLTGSRLGVHQFYASDYLLHPSFYLALGQSKSADILAFLTESRADPKLLNLMVAAPPQAMHFVSHDVLRELRVITDEIFLESWEFEIVAGLPYLRGHVVEVRGEHKLILMSAPTGALVAIVLFGTHYKQHVIDASDSLGFFIGDELATVPPELVIARPCIQDNYVAWMFEIPWPMAERMREAKGIGSAAQPPNKDVYMGFHIKIGSGRRKIDQLLEACRIAKGVPPTKS